MKKKKCEKGGCHPLAIANVSGAMYSEGSRVTLQRRRGTDQASVQYFGKAADDMNLIQGIQMFLLRSACCLSQWASDTILYMLGCHDDVGVG